MYYVCCSYTTKNYANATRTHLSKMTISTALVTGDSVVVVVVAAAGRQAGHPIWEV